MTLFLVGLAVGAAPSIGAALISGLSDYPMDDDGMRFRRGNGR